MDESTVCVIYIFCFKQKTAYEMRISDWSSDVCSSDLKVAELKQAREKLVAAFDAGAKEASPDAAALAQANYDCWLEQQEENYQPEHIKSCRDALDRKSVV